MNRLNNVAKRVQVLAALIEGGGINSIVRMTGVAKHMLLNLLGDMGCACAAYLHFMYCNFVRVHKTLRVTPAMEAGIADHVWSIEEIASLLPEPTFGPRGPYRKKN